MTAFFDEEANVVSGTLNIGSGTIYDIILSETSGEPTLFNQNMLDVDFAVSGTGQGDVLYYDASTSRVGINTIAPDTTLHVVTDCANNGLKVENTTDCISGVRLLLVHNCGTAPSAGSYPATIDLAGRDTNASTINYAQIRSRILDPDSASPTGEILFTVNDGGTVKTVFQASPIDVVLGSSNEASGNFYNVVGYGNTVSGELYILVGNNNDITTNTGIVIGNNVYNENDYVVLIGNDIFSSGSSNIVIAVEAEVSGLQNVAIGSNVYVTGDNTIVIGNSNHIDGDSFIGLASSANIVGQSGIGFGVVADIQGDANIYVGSNIVIEGNDDIAIGSNINVTGDNNIVYGNSSDVSGNNITSIGVSNAILDVNSGIYIGNDIGLNASSQSVIIGLGISTTGGGLDNSLLVGINNTTLDGSPTGLVVLGQGNSVSQIKESLIVGNENNLSGTVANNIIVGPKNHVPITSNNNLVVGLLNNTTGIVISTDGSIVGDGVRAEGDAMSNTNIFGINNWIANASGSLVFGNKSRVSGANINSLGSYDNLNGNQIQSLGNSNFVMGDNSIVIGSKNDIFGDSSISVNTSSDRNQLFGDQTIVIGHNEVVVSGMGIGFENEIYGPNNIVFGRDNLIGKARFPCLSSGVEVVVLGDVRTYFNPGDNILVGIYGPASQDQSTYIRTINDGENTIVYSNIGTAKTTLQINTSIVSTNTIEYFIKDAFDDVNYGEDPCSECYASEFAGYSSGYVIVFQDGNDDTDLINNPLYGNANIVLGTSNTTLHASGLVLGNRNNVSGTNHVVIGHGIRGDFDNTLQIGTNNTNKIVLDNDKIVFNTGEYQADVYFNSSNPDTEGNDSRVMSIDLSVNRVGVNVTDPRSTLDVSGTLTTEALRVGLTGIAGYALISDEDGVATWQFPVNLSGQNSGLIFKVGDQVGSGVREIVFNTGTRELTYLRADKNYATDGSFVLDEGDVDERALIIGVSGMYLNNEGNDWGYNLVVKGSGVQDDAIDGDDSVYLLKTMIPQNAIRVHNITGVSGYLDEIAVTGGVVLPVNLSGTVLSVTSQGNLITTSFDTYDILFAGSNLYTSGTNRLRYYPASRALTIGTASDPPLGADTSLLQGSNNTHDSVIIGASNGVNTVFNNAGASNHFFIVAESNAQTTKKGMQFYSNSGSLGLGVQIDSNDWNVSDTLTGKYWWETSKLLVDGKVRARSLQLTPDGKTLPGVNSVDKYLKVIDSAGNIGLDTIQLNYQFSGINPIAVTEDTQTQKLNIKLADLDGVGDNGRMLSWNGSAWRPVNGFRVRQNTSTSTSTDDLVGIEFGSSYGLDLNSCINNHVFGGGSFGSTETTPQEALIGSSQLSRFYLRGRTTGTTSSELTADWHKNVSSNPSPSEENTISLSFRMLSANEHDRTQVWNYTVNYSAVLSDGTAYGFKGVAGTVRGSLLSYIDSVGARITSKLGSDDATDKRYSSGLDYSVVNPITVSIEDDANDSNVKRLAITANGRTGFTGMWSVVVDINQVHMPPGINFGNTDVS